MKNKAFTLIELLVTIAIMALLAAIIFASLSNARTKAEVAKMKTQGKEIDKALELSRLSTGTYPVNIDHTITAQDSIGSDLGEYISSVEGVMDVPDKFTGIDDSEFIYLSDGQYATNTYAYFKCGETGDIDPYVKYFESTQIPAEVVQEGNGIYPLYQNYCQTSTSFCASTGYGIRSSGDTIDSPDDLDPDGWGASSLIRLCVFTDPDCGAESSYYYCVK